MRVPEVPRHGRARDGIPTPNTLSVPPNTLSVLKENFWAIILPVYGM